MADSLPPAAPKAPLFSPEPGCVLLRRFFYYRLILALSLLGLFYFGAELITLGRLSPLLFAATGFSYLGFIVAQGVLLVSRRHSCEHHAYLMVFLDIPAVTLVMHASGGIETGLGLLLAISISFGSLIMRGRAALVFASIAALSILTQQTYTELTQTLSTVAYTQAGLLGASFFAIALLSETLARRLRESERLAIRRGIDLANQVELNAYIIRHMQVGVLVLDTNLQIRLLNESAARMLGLGLDAKGKPLQPLQPALASRLKAEQPQTAGRGAPTLFQSGEGPELQLQINPLGKVEPAGLLLFMEDAAAINEAAQQMKLASLGRLTASIAHEIRNPLGAISHAEQLLGESEHLAAPDLRLIEIIHNHAARVNGIIEDVLRLSRRTQAARTALDLGPWLEEFVPEFRLRYPLQDQQVRIQARKRPIQVAADGSQLRQILDNLCGNAAAHFDRPLEQLRITLRYGMDSRYALPYLEVSDNGPGIPDDLLNQVFEPFFTTRNTGTGLGLYIARELSQANRLKLECIAQNAPGCTFRLLFTNQTS